MFARLGRWCLGLIKRTLQYYWDRIREAARYLLFLVGATSINALIMIPLCLVTSWILTHFGFNMMPPPGIDYDIPRTLPVLAALCLAIGIFEEVYFRYFIQDCLLDRYLKVPPVVAWILASLIFGAVHLLNPGAWIARLPQAIGASGAGLWFGWLYKKRGLHVAILTHALYDFLIMALSLLSG